MLEQVEDERQRFFVGNEIGLVDFQSVDDRSDAAEPDAFGDRAAFGRRCLAVLEQMVHRRAARIGDTDDDVLFLLAQECRRARDRAAGADRADEAVDLAAAFFPDLRPGRDVVRLAVVEIVPLVGEDHAVLFGLLELLGEPSPDMLIVVRVGVGRRRHLDQLGAAQPQHVLLFLALRLGDDDQRAVAARIGDERKADAGIAGGCLDDQAAGAQLAALFRLQDHLPAGAVLHRAARVHELGLAEDGAAGRLRGALQLDERRMADGFDNAVADLHARSRGIKGGFDPSGGPHNVTRPEKRGRSRQGNSVELRRL